MSITSPEQFEKLRACGIIVGRALRAMAAAVRPAITTAELSALIFAAVQDFAGKAPQEDDMTVVLVKRSANE